MGSAPWVSDLAVLDASDRRAIVEPEVGQLTYAELDRLVARVASRLRELGVDGGHKVGICLPRSADVIALMLGALRAGGAFVPLDPAAPHERNAQMLIDCGVRVAFVTDQGAAAGLSDAISRQGGHIDLQVLGGVGLGRAIDAWAPDAAAPVVPQTADSVASVFYTSGSTGRPKGVVMTRGARAAFAGWIRDRFAPTPDDVFASHVHFHFSMSAFDLLGALGTGASLVLLPDEIRTVPERVADVIERERVTIWFAGPAILTQIVKLGRARSLRSLRILAFSGEVFPIAHLRELRRQLPEPQFLNVWGSTETHVGTVHEVPRAELESPPPVGTPCPHFEYRVVDEHGGDVAAGTPGELLLRGPGLYAGYLNQPELTAEKHLADPAGGARWYRTGDLVTQLPGGELRYAGRLGRMVKLRGHRIEPGEIEARLYEHPDILEAGVILEGDEENGELVAHLRAQGKPPSILALKQFCATKLPPYLIPKRFVFYDALPRNANGKIDLKRLGT